MGQRRLRQGISSALGASSDLLSQLVQQQINSKLIEARETARITAQGIENRKTDKQRQQDEWRRLIPDYLEKGWTHDQIATLYNSPGLEALGVPNLSLPQRVEAARLAAGTTPTRPELRAAWQARSPEPAGPFGGVGAPIEASNPVQNLLRIPEAQVARVGAEERSRLEAEAEHAQTPLAQRVRDLTADQAGTVARSEAKARAEVTYSPENVAARIREGVAIANAASTAERRVEQQIAADTAERAAVSQATNFSRLVTLSAELNDLQGLPARLAGAGASVAGALGFNEKIAEWNQLKAIMTRPIALASGAREANVSDSDLERIDTIFSITPSSTADERRTALRHLRNMLFLGPVLAADFDIEVPYSMRLDTMLGATQRLLDAEDAFIQGIEALEASGAIIEGDLTFLDPTTGIRMPVIRSGVR